MKGVVVHCKRSEYGVLIDRTTIYGNPFVMQRGRKGERERVMQAFEGYARKRIERDPEFREAVKALLGRVLGCWCAPLACHGDVLLKLAEELHYQDAEREHLGDPDKKTGIYAP